jgi:hypothetical protein
LTNLTPYEFSDKLTAYLGKVERATGREAIISMGTGHPAAKAELRRESPFILDIHIAQHVRMSPAEFERLVAHKAAYGLLFFARGYPSWKAGELSGFEIFRLNTLSSAILDTVADVEAFKAGFGIDEEMIPAAKRVLKAVRQGEDIFREDMPPEMRTLGIVQTALKPWSLYIHLKALPEKETIGSFLRAMEKAYPREWEIIRHCRAAILANDIFTPEGYAAAFRSVLGVFGIEGVEVNIP